MDKFLTINEIAETLKIGRRTVIRWVLAGRLKAFKIGRFWRVQRSDFLRFINSNKEG